MEVLNHTTTALELQLSDLLRDMSLSTEEYDASLSSSSVLIGSWSPPNISSKFRNVKSTSGMLKSSRQTSSSQTPRSCIFWDHSCKVRLDGKTQWNWKVVIYEMNRKRCLPNRISLTYRPPFCCQTRREMLVLLRLNWHDELMQKHSNCWSLCRNWMAVT